MKCEGQTLQPKQTHTENKSTHSKHLPGIPRLATGHVNATNDALSYGIKDVEGELGKDNEVHSKMYKHCRLMLHDTMNGLRQEKKQHS